jgi:hypothetical protein
MRARRVTFGPAIADNVFFGVRAVDALGRESRTAIPAQP